MSPTGRQDAEACQASMLSKKESEWKFPVFPFQIIPSLVKGIKRGDVDMYIEKQVFILRKHIKIDY